MKQIILLGSGGFVGTVFCYKIQQFGIKHFAHLFPVGTFVVNITGCFIIGILYAIAARNFSFSPEWRLFLITGFCGGYTTFSTFSYEGIQLFRQGNYLFFFWYTALSVCLGFVATFAGLYLAE
jgi:CrcB protein